ncbi:hypothetical protein QTP88_014858 [Uroleucon formosanum]
MSTRQLRQRDTTHGEEPTVARCLAQSYTNDNQLSPATIIVVIDAFVEVMVTQMQKRRKGRGSNYSQMFVTPVLAHRAGSLVELKTVDDDFTPSTWPVTSHNFFSFGLMFENIFTTYSIKLKVTDISNNILKL